MNSRKSDTSPKSTIVRGGDREWRLDGLLHREDGPAIIYRNGDCDWYIFGRLHRDDGPAVVTVTGTELWYQNGLVHRDGGEPAAVFTNGDREWRECGLKHRVDGPAVMANDADSLWYAGDEWWYRGALHRSGGGFAKSDQSWKCGNLYSTEQLSSISRTISRFMKYSLMRIRLQQMYRKRLVDTALFKAGATVFPGMCDIICSY